MSILIDKNTRVLVRAGTFRAKARQTMQTATDLTDAAKKVVAAAK